MDKLKGSVVNYSGSSEHLKKKLDVQKTIDTRLKVLMVVLCGLAGVLVFRLYQIQILQADHFANLYEKHQTPPIYSQTKRGEILASNGEALVMNKPNKTITYFAPPQVNSEEQWETAKLFAKQFNIKYELNEDDLKVLWIRQNTENGKAKALMTAEEVSALNSNKMKSAEYEALKKSRVTDAMTATLTEEEKNTFYVLNKMHNVQMAQSAIVLEEATNEQIAYLRENAASFPGFSYTTKWNRDYNDKVDVKFLLGDVGEARAEKLEYLKAEGYQADDLVGNSGLEYQYESILSGIDSEYMRESKKGLVESREGEKGRNLRLAMDIDLQQVVEKELKAELEKTKSDPRRKTFNQMHMVVSDPRTGDILAMAAMVRNSKGEYVNDLERTMLSTGTYPVGSTVKPATVYMSLNEGVVKKDEAILDTPMYISGTPEKASWQRGLGNVNAVDALMKSSNVYMYHMAIRLGKTQYIPNGPLVFPNAADTFDLMRNYYSQFGLGVATQIDYPREEIGYKGGKSNSGSILDFAVGQFDNYNALQLNQYVSTLANGGTRMKPRLVIEALDQDTKKVVYENPPTILNTIDNKEALNTAREGMYACAMKNWCYANTSANYTSAAKTGTAQAYTDTGEYVRNSTYLTFAPYESPKVAISCIAPNAYYDKYPEIQNSCGFASTKVLDWYMASGKQ